MEGGVDYCSPLIGGFEKKNSEMKIVYSSMQEILKIFIMNISIFDPCP